MVVPQALRGFTISSRAIVYMVAVVTLAGCAGAHMSFLDPQGPVAAQQKTHFLTIIVLMMIVVLPVLILTPLLIWQYRYGHGGTYRPKARLPWWVEIVLLGIPFLVVAVLSVLLWRNTIDLDPWRPIDGRGAPLRIQAVGYDWKWLFIYPDLDIATVGELVFLADRPLAIELTSQTVMQSFWIPALGGQVYAMGSGMVTQLHLIADGPGSFRGLNTQYNGKGFSGQRFTARALNADHFANWVTSARAGGVPLDNLALDALTNNNTAPNLARVLPASPDRSDATVIFHPVPEAFFGRIVARAGGHAP